MRHHVLTTLYLLSIAGLLAVALTSSCGSGDAAVVARETRTVELTDGTTIEVPVRAERILPANASLFDFVADLVDPARVVGIPKVALEYSGIAADPEAWADKPHLARFEGENILTLDPDVLLVQAYQSPGTIEKVRAAGVIVIELPVATSWVELVETIELLGRVLDVEERAAELVAGLERRREALGESTRPLRILPYGNYGSSGMTAGKKTTHDLMIDLAGMQNAAAEAGLVGNVEIDYEQILQLDPDVFLVGGDNGERSPTAVFLRNEGTLAGLKAVREGRIVVLPTVHYSTASHLILDAAEELVERLADL